MPDAEELTDPRCWNVVAWRRCQQLLAGSNRLWRFSDVDGCCVNQRSFADGAPAPPTAEAWPAAAAAAAAAVHGNRCTTLLTPLVVALGGGVAAMLPAFIHSSRLGSVFDATHALIWRCKQSANATTAPGISFFLSVSDARPSKSSTRLRSVAVWLRPHALRTMLCCCCYHCKVATCHRAC